MRLCVTDIPRFGRTVDSVVLLRKVDPDDADRIVRAGGDLRFRMSWSCVPEEFGVVEEGGVFGNSLYLPLADRERIMLRPGRTRKLCQNLTRGIDRSDRSRFA